MRKTEGKGCSEGVGTAHIRNNKRLRAPLSSQVSHRPSYTPHLAATRGKRSVTVSRCPTTSHLLGLTLSIHKPHDQTSERNLAPFYENFCQKTTQFLFKKKTLFLLISQDDSCLQLKRLIITHPTWHRIQGTFGRFTITAMHLPPHRKQKNRMEKRFNFYTSSGQVQARKSLSF